MICQAYKSNLAKFNEEAYTEYESSYVYETESYDFRPYESTGTDEGKFITRGFNYN